LRKEFDMKVLLITGSYPPMKCGVGDYSYHLAKALAADPKVSVSILTSVFDGVPDKISGVEIFPVIRRWDIAEAPRVMKIIRRWSPDIVHIQYPSLGYYNGLLPRILPMISFLMGKTVVQTWHEGRSALGLFLLAVFPSTLVVLHPSYKKLLNPMLRWALLRKPVFIPVASNIPVIKIDKQKQDALKQKHLKNQKRLIVFFGFVYPHKGIELLFQIADPVSDQIVIAGELGAAGDYGQEILRRSSVEPWLGKTTITGFLPNDDISALLSVADAVILPFRNGGGDWNRGSVKASVTHGAFTITTSLTQNGYDKKHNVYYAKVDDVQEMKTALNNYAGKRRDYDADIDRNEWREFADKHRSLYEHLLSE